MSEILRTNEILSKGYGVSPKLVMIDENLSIEAKAIYAYLSSFCGSGNIAFPQISTIVNHLKVSNERFYKHFKLLIKYGYISVSQERTQGKFANNVYTLNTVVTPILEEEEEQSETEFTETGNTDNGKTVDRNTVAEFSDNGKSKANNNNINNNSINNNNINNKKEKERADEINNKINNNISKDKKTDFDNLINSYTENSQLKETIYEFIKMRTAIKKPMTTKALDILLNKLGTLASDDDIKIKVLEQSIEHSWQTVYALKENNNGKDIRNSGEFGHRLTNEAERAKGYVAQKKTTDEYSVRVKPVEITPTDYAEII